eukprot:GAHX01002052.1.p1 GENE.GAHX01002052.1~~GAHX01002052.1.p1  ORF type:complete len:254 (-),score=42.04 GAHX01002052.1:27-788(-)
MSYDSSITLFSPDGHLFQIEYANEAVKRGASVLIAKTLDTIFLSFEEESNRISLVETPHKPFIKHNDPSMKTSGSATKLCKINETTFCTFSGLKADANVLVFKMQQEAQNIYLKRDMSATTRQIADYIGNEVLIATQRKGMRPYGVSLLLFGNNELQQKQEIFEVKPSGSVYEWKATAIGKGQEELVKKLENTHSQARRECYTENNSELFTLFKEIDKKPENENDDAEDTGDVKINRRFFKLEKGRNEIVEII